MPQNIYLGSVKVQDIRTGEIITIDRKIYKELENVTHDNFRGYVLKKVHPSERKYFKIVRLCFETARVTGTTNY